MPREKAADKKARAAEVERRMFSRYGEGKMSLESQTPFQHVCAVMLSAQTTDASVNKVTPELFARYGTPELMAQARAEDVEQIIHSLGFYHSKAKHLVECAQVLVSDYGGIVPDDVDELQKLPGVGRKTANCVMCDAFGKAQGIAVDTHVFRIAHRLKFAGPSDDTPAKTESKLLKLYPEEDWLYINHQWVTFGREFCSSQRPKCAGCFINDLCPSYQGR